MVTQTCETEMTNNDGLKINKLSNKCQTLVGESVSINGDGQFVQEPHVLNNSEF